MGEREERGEEIIIDKVIEEEKMRIIVKREGGRVIEGKEKERIKSEIKKKEEMEG